MNMSRRVMLAAMGSAALPLAARSKRARKIGIQLYMLGDDVGKTLDATLDQVAKIGFAEVELPQTYGRTGAQLAAAMRQSGLTCPSIHVSLHAFFPGATSFADGADKIAELANAIGARNVVVPLMPFSARVMRKPNPGEDFRALLSSMTHAMTGDEWKQAGDTLNQHGKTLAKHGVRIGYHNHNVEFNPLADGRIPYDVLVAATDPSLVDLEFDIGWGGAAGLDPAAFIRRYGKRITQLHIKDMGETPKNFALQVNSVDLGKGVLDWPTILKAARDVGVKHYFVEQEPPFVRPRIESAAVAHGFMARVL